MVCARRCRPAMSSNPTFSGLSALSRNGFVAKFSEVYEHSPWVAERAWDAGLNVQHETLDELAASLARIVDEAGDEAQLTLIKAHPDLAGRAAQRGELTNASNDEQSSAGIDQCSAEEFTQFGQYNDRYKQKFGFPFIMAVKNSNRHLILAAFNKRLENDYATEFAEAIRQIHHIARFRLQVISEQWSTV